MSTSPERKNLLHDCDKRIMHALNIWNADTATEPLVIQLPILMTETEMSVTALGFAKPTEVQLINTKWNTLVVIKNLN